LIHLCGDRLQGLVFGSEDLSAELGVEITNANMQFFAQQVIMHAVANDIPAFGMVGKFGVFKDDEKSENTLAEYVSNLEFSKSLGFSGIFCIHPSQLPKINEVFKLSKEKAEEYHQILSAYEQSEKSVISFNGQLYGPPMIARIRKILSK